MSPVRVLCRWLGRLARPGLVVAGLAFAAGAAQAQAQATPPAVEDPDSSSQAEVGSVVALELRGRPALTLSGSAEWDEGLETVMGALEKVRAEMAKAGLAPAGRPMAVFTETDDQGFKYTAMLPIASKPEPPPALGQDVKLGETPAGKAMKFEHRGSYDDIDTSYEAITAYLDEKGLEAQNLFIEEYLTTPNGPDDESLEVDIYVFLK